MAKKRTRQDKLRVAARRHLAVVTEEQLPAEQFEFNGDSISNVPAKKTSLVSIFGFGPELIWRDLQKTVVVFGLILILLAAAVVWFQAR